MIFLAPVYLVAAGAVAAGVVALHFLSTREPDTDLLPTVRFIPDVPCRPTPSRCASATSGFSSCASS